MNLSPTNSPPTTSRPFSRRAFLAIAGAAVVGGLTGCGGGGGGGGGLSADGEGVVAYRLSVHGRRSSNASKKNAANKVFRTRSAAFLGRAHAGEKSDVVPIVLSKEQAGLFFANGDEADRRWFAKAV